MVLVLVLATYRSSPKGRRSVSVDSADSGGVGAFGDDGGGGHCAHDIGAHDGGSDGGCDGGDGGGD